MKKIFALVFISGAVAIAASTSVLTADGFRSSDRTKTWSLPAATDTLLGRTSTDTLTNKSISGSSNTLSNLPLGSVTGTLAAANGGTGSASFTKGDLLVTPGSTTINKLAVGADGTVLTADSASTNGVKWGTALTNPMTTSGDIIYGGSGGAATRLAAGSSGQILKSNGTSAPSWVNESSLPGSVTSNDPTALRMSKFQFGGGGLAACSTSPCVISKAVDASWFTSVTRSSVGRYVINGATAGYLPECFVNNTVSASTKCTYYSDSTSAVGVNCNVMNTASGADENVQLICFGAR